MSFDDEDEGSDPRPERPLEDRTRPIPALVDEDATVVSPVDEDGASTASAASSTQRSSIAPTAALSPMLLERIEPSLGRGERLRLDAAHWRLRVGRAEHNDLRLYTASASRDHAVIEGTEAGAWVLTPLAGKAVSVDGDPMQDPVELEVGMNLVFGGDHLRCVADAPPREETTSSTLADGRPASGTSGRGGRASWILIGVIAATGLGLMAYAWFAA